MNFASIESMALPIIIGVLALAFITMPLWMGNASETKLRKSALVISREQLELDRELGKIDAAEYDELNALLPAEEPKFGSQTVESLIGAFRRKRKLNLSVEAEVLVARARRKMESKENNAI